MKMYNRILLKLSGEGLSESSTAKEKAKTYSAEILDSLYHALSLALSHHVQVALVIGGGNFYRGVFDTENFVHRSTADMMGMLATVMNGCFLEDYLTQKGLPVYHASSLPVDNICPAYVSHTCRSYLDQRHIVILSGGTGHAFCTTDTAAVVKALELKCDILLKATKVDGVYSEDPVLNPKAIRYDQLSYKEALSKNLKVMDQTAMTLAMENKLPIGVFSMRNTKNFGKVLTRTGDFTLIKEGL